MSAYMQFEFFSNILLLFIKFFLNNLVFFQTKFKLNKFTLRKILFRFLIELKF